MKATQEIRLTGVDSLDDCERAVERINAQRDYSLTVHAGSLSKRRGALRDAAYLQALLTWVRLNPEGTLGLLGGGTQSDVLRDACDYSVGIATLALAGAIKINGDSALRQQVLAPAKPRIEAAYQGNYDDLLKGRTVDLLSVSGAERQYLKPLFSGPAATLVRDKFDLRATVRGLAKRAAPASPDLDERTLSALAGLTHELFENTQDHAITDEFGDVFRRHVELLTVGWIAISEATEQNDLLHTPSLAEYWAELAERQQGREKVAGFCFNFLDSGPGMAARIRRRPLRELTPQQEAEALRECLEMHTTSKSTHATGGGLSAVLNEVSESRGFIRIRSGRQAIFKAFKPSAVGGRPCDGFEEWFGSGRSLYRVAGTLVSVFIPLPRPTL